MAQETELKLSLETQHLPRLLAHPLLSAHMPHREHLCNTYFDTPTLALMGQRMAVRERQVGDRTLLTVKTAGRSVGGLSQRHEWEAPTVPGRFDFAALVDDPALAAQLSALAGELVPVFHTDFMRCSWQLAHDGAQVEVALDQGFISAGPAREALLELELELKSGPQAALLDLARVLSQDAAGHAPPSPWLHPSDRSKAERGLALFLRSSGDPAAGH